MVGKGGRRSKDGEGVRAAFYQSAFAWKDTNNHVILTNLLNAVLVRLT